MKTIHQPPVSRAAMNLAYLVTQNARRCPERTALVWRERSWTWRELDARVSALAAALLGLGVQPGEGVLVHSKNSNEMLESMLATFRIGAVWVPTNFRLMPDDVAYMAEVVKPRVFLCQTDFPEYAEAVSRVTPGTQRVWLTGEARAQRDTPSANALIDAQAGRPVANAMVQWDSACWLFFTSGTTGRPKAAVLTHGQMGFVITNHLCDLMPGATEDDGSLGGHLLGQRREQMAADKVPKQDTEHLVGDNERESNRHADAFGLVRDKAEHGQRNTGPDQHRHVSSARPAVGVRYAPIDERVGERHELRHQQRRDQRGRGQANCVTIARRQ